MASKQNKPQDIAAQLRKEGATKVKVACSDIDDDRSCVVETKEQEFKALRLLQPDGPR